MIQIFPENSKLPDRARVKFGIDPTGDRLHLGHLVPLRVVEDLQSQGHEIHLVIGSLTAQLGDPSGRDKTRPIINEEEVEKNAWAILHQVESIITDFKLHWNNDFYTSVPELLRDISRFTVARLMSRDAFQKRVADGGSVAAHELLVPILQGLDSVFIEAQIEVGGNDQLFNFSLTRELQEMKGQTPEVCLLCPIINGTDGRKMSKSYNNCIYMDEPPNDMFGKVMSISDETMGEWEPLLSLEPVDMSRGPMHRKKALAHGIVAQCHGQKAAKDAWEYFEQTVQRKAVPDDVQTVKGGGIIDIIVSIRQCSRSDARRLIGGGGVDVDGVRITDVGASVTSGVVRVGKLSVARIQ